MDPNNAGIGPLSVFPARFISVRGLQGSVFPRSTSMRAPQGCDVKGIGPKNRLCCSASSSLQFHLEIHQGTHYFLHLLYQGVMTSLIPEN